MATLNHDEEESYSTEIIPPCVGFSHEAVGSTGGDYLVDLGRRKDRLCRDAGGNRRPQCSTHPTETDRDSKVSSIATSRREIGLCCFSKNMVKSFSTHSDLHFDEMVLQQLASMPPDKSSIFFAVTQSFRQSAHSKRPIPGHNYPRAAPSPGWRLIDELNQSCVRGTGAPGFK
jgi:hypothetical protein